jgi:hypothetical protein
MLLLLSTSYDAFSQNSFAGIKISVNISNLIVDKRIVCQPDTKGNIGIYKKYYLNKSLFVTPELQYSGQGFYTLDYNFNITNPGPNIFWASRYIKRDDYYLHYLKVPLYIGYEPFNKGLSLQLGIYTAYLIKARLKTNQVLVDQKQDVSSAFNRIDFGYALSLRYELKNGFNYCTSIEYGIKCAVIGTKPKETTFNYTFGVGYTLCKNKKIKSAEPQPES